MFTVADVILVNKIDLLPYSNFDTQAYRKSVKGLNDKIEGRYPALRDRGLRSGWSG
jgi:Ni2+-binding GTPase involved in maturation of urease and hydrogenase